MVGVDGGFVKHNPIRGVLGDELPWEVGSAAGSLTSDGHLVISVRGIVFSNDPEVPANLRGHGMSVGLRRVKNLAPRSMTAKWSPSSWAKSRYCSTKTIAISPRPRR